MHVDCTCFTVESCSGLLQLFCQKSNLVLITKISIGIHNIFDFILQNKTRLIHWLKTCPSLPVDSAMFFPLWVSKGSPTTLMWLKQPLRTLEILPDIPPMTPAFLKNPGEQFLESAG